MVEKGPAKGNTAKQVLARNIRTARKRAGISQRQLSELSGVSQPHISQVEQALLSVGIDYVELLSQALGITVSDLFDPLFCLRNSIGKKSDAGEPGQDGR